MTNIEIKKQLYNYCSSYVTGKEEQVIKAMNIASEGLETESKSTAGDKHDTGRAMMHLEIEKKVKQLNSIKQLKAVLTRFSPNLTTTKIELGALVKTNKGNYYIGISAGSITIDNQNFYLISLASPLGQALIKFQNHSNFDFMGEKLSILSIK